MTETDSFDPADTLPADRGVESMDSREMFIVEAMHTVAQRHGIVLACERCRQPFQGLNSPQDPTQSISCGCREIRSINKHRTSHNPAGN